MCQRTFDSKAEARRGEELLMLERASEIQNLEYQVTFKLCEHPNIKIKLDFKYKRDGAFIYEDVKGVLEREFRVKLAWLKEKFDIDVLLLKSRGKYWEIGSITNPSLESTE